MSFYSAFRLCRPTKPPVVTGAALAAFIESFKALGLSEPEGLFHLNVKFGRSIDRDDKDTVVYSPTDSPIAYVTSIAWDLQPKSVKSLDEIVGHLRVHDRPIYRAEVGLGAMTDELLAYMNSTSGLDGAANLGLDSWGIHCVPERVGLLSTEEKLIAGWLGVGMHGPGHMYPLTHAELVRRAERHTGLVALRDLCRQTWPVSSARAKAPLWWHLPHKRKHHVYDMRGGRPTRRVQRARALMGEAWPYPVEAAFDWKWLVRETG